MPGLDISSIVQDWQNSVARHVIAKDDPALLADHALHLARVLAYPELDVPATLLKIDDMGKHVAAELKKKRITCPTMIIEQLNNFLFNDLKFRPCAPGRRVGSC